MQKAVHETEQTVYRHADIAGQTTLEGWPGGGRTRPQGHDSAIVSCIPPAEELDFKLTAGAELEGVKRMIHIISPLQCM